MAVCSRCEHPIGFHGSPAGCRARYLVGDPPCACPDATPAHPGEELRQCRAELVTPGEKNLRCEILVTRGTTHVGVSDHRAQVEGGYRVNWTDMTATYPLRDLPAPASEHQVGGDHYRKHAIQLWDIIDEYGLSYYAGNALKYLLRDKGNRLEDLKKARHYLDKLIELEEGK